MNLNVLVYVAPPLVIETNIIDKNGNKTKKYSGLLYDIWTIVKERLVEKKMIQGYKETFVNNDNNKMTLIKAHDLVSNGPYDIGIGYFSVVKSRINTQFTRPIYLNKYAIAYLPNESEIETISKGLFRGFIKPVTIGIIIAFLIFIIFKFIPKHLLSKEWNKTGSWELITALIFKSTFKYRKNPSLSNAVILVLELLFGVYFIGEMTTTLRDVKSDLYNNKINKESIINKLILTPKGYTNSNHWIKYGAIIEENKTDNILDTYEKNTNKYFGLFDDLEILKQFKIKNNNLVISAANFGFDEIAWIIKDTNQLHDVLYNINNEIIILQHDHTIMNLCKTYFHRDEYLCEL